jgi:thiol-disulfide isomerase/thioredoxin
MKFKKTLWIGLAAACLIMVAAGCGSTASSQPTVNENARNLPTVEDQTANSGTFPTFSAQDTAGNTVTNSVFADKKITVINVWASYCGYCIQEMPGLETLSKKYPQVGFLGIPTDITKASSVKDVMNQTGVSYTNILPNSDLIKNFLGTIAVVPTTVVVDSQGNILQVVQGGRSQDAMDQIIQSHLS